MEPHFSYGKRNGMNSVPQKFMYIQNLSECDLIENMVFADLIS